MEKSISLGIGYGVLCDPIAKQIEFQGFKFDEKKIKELQKTLDALHIIRFSPINCPDSIYDKLIKRLHSKVVAHVKIKNKMK